MATVIDFATRQVRTDDTLQTAKIEIIDHDEAPYVIIDGLVPRALAYEIVAMCERHNEGARK